MEAEPVINKIAAGQEHSFFYDTKSWQVFACGESRQGQLGLSKRHEEVRTPEFVQSLLPERVIQIAAGDMHTLVINFDGKVLATGSNVTG